MIQSNNRHFPETGEKGSGARRTGGLCGAAYGLGTQAINPRSNNADGPLSPVSMNGIVLAGGLSSRMGQDKACLPWGESNLLHAVLERLTPVCEKVIVVSNIERSIKQSNVMVVADHYKLCGPLGGMQAGLAASDADYNFIAACDMPYLNTDAVAYIKQVAIGYDAAVPYIDGHYNPLHAVYRQTCLPYINQMLADNNYRILNFYSQIRLRQIAKDELQLFDGDLRTLSNVNTRGDYEKLRDANR